METLKNFFTGLLVIILLAIIIAICVIAWPFILGLGSVLLSIIAIILLIVLFFYVITLVGYVARALLKKKK
jgi:hypothetical protein